MLTVTAISASILAFIYVKLSLNVVGYRRKYRISVGDGGEENLLRSIGAQSNLAEYAPIGLILVACLEYNGAPIWISSVLAAMLVLGRILHPIGMKDPAISWQPRMRGMQLTLFSIVALGIANIGTVVWRIFSG
ncbi:MAG: MAPEG family protein [Granulosicoccus sp.]|nr:MAPEG family protein [Granulosicoccus sp.]